MADKTVGSNIRMFREARGLLQKDLAEKIGKKAGTVSNWELGLRDPGADNIKRIAAALEISPAELIGHNAHIMQDDCFELICSDESMIPVIEPGDLLTVSKSGKPCDGDIVVADLCDPEGTAPVVRMFASSGGSTFLIPLNRNFPYQTESKFTIRGKVTEFTRKL